MLPGLIVAKPQPSAMSCSVAGGSCGAGGAAGAGGACPAVAVPPGAFGEGGPARPAPPGGPKPRPGNPPGGGGGARLGSLAPPNIIITGTGPFASFGTTSVI